VVRVKNGSWVVRHGSCILALTLAVLPPCRLVAQKLEDNSFLVEEAYNQPARVVQHILTAAAAEGTTGLSFTQEWPVGSQRHQLSYTLVGVNDDALDLGDALLNYRYQLSGGEGESFFAAPRASLLLPLGDADRRAGNGGYGLQLALPLSWEALPRLSLHGNLGGTWRPNAEDLTGSTAATLDGYAGASAIFFVTDKVNLLAESVWRHGRRIRGEGRSEGVPTHTVSLGARAGFDVGSVQFVPGVAYLPAIDELPEGVFFYLSVEHGF
jgi:hypothetical protein